MNDWKEVRLGEVCLKIGSGATPKGGQSSYLNMGISLIRSQNVIDFSFSKNGLAFISQNQAQSLSNVEVQPDDVLLNITGDSVARVCQVPADVLPARVNQHVAIVRPDGRNLSNGFVKYWLLSPQTKNRLLSLAQAGATRNALTKGMIEALPILLPPLHEQRAIAEVLGALDDKIEHNRRTNETLEALARSLFRDWFVDFGPTRAKAEGREAYLAPDLWALFPDAFNEEGIPEGWRWEPLSSIIEMIGGGTPKTSVTEYWNGHIPWFSVVDAPSNSDVFVVDTEKKITQAGLSNSSTKILRKGTTIVTARGTVGKLALAGVDLAMNQSCYGIVGAQGFGDCLTYFSVKSAVDRLKDKAHGSVFDTITRSTFDSVSATVSAPATAWAFEELASPMMESILKNVLENQKLAEMRDCLLPKLISGEVRVREAEKIVGESV